MTASVAAGAGVLAAYVAGSFPTAYLAGRLLKGIDLRAVGSGNLGATNVYRALGAVPAIVVLLVDAAKGALPALVLPRALGLDDGAGWALIFGACAIVGHAKPVFLLWKGGGKGVATAAGVFGAVAPWPLAWSVAVFALVLAASRIVSVASMVAAVALPIFVWRAQGAGAVFGVSAVVAAFVVWMHRANIDRLRRGVEPRLGRPGSATR